MRTGRRALLALALGAVSTAGRVQGAAATVHRIGWLSATHVDSLWEVFIRGLRERGWVEGRNIEFDRVYSGGFNDRFPALASQLVQRNADIIVCAGTPPALAARDATNRIPIVFWAAGDPVGSGLVDSLGRPGRNLTGTSAAGTTLPVKQLELLKELLPAMTRVAVFTNDTLPLLAIARANVEAVARPLGVTLIPLQVKVPADIDVAFAAIARDRIDALLILGEPFLAGERARLAKLALDQRLPTASPFEIATEAGLLLSYSSRFVDHVQRIPHYVDRILRGAKPAELPVEQPNRFYISINLRTAAALDIKVPASTLARVDQVFQ
jgi:putative ABC transport system substrate-binding protein